jgi:hypothetical protein
MLMLWVLHLPYFSPKANKVTQGYIELLSKLTHSTSLCIHPLNLERIRNIAKQANRFKIDYELKYADKIMQKARR